MARERRVADAKKTLLELIAHYLRTPLTVVLGGIDMMETEGSAAVTGLKSLGQHLKQTVEQLLAQTRLATEQATMESGTIAMSGGTVWRQPGLFLPLVLIAAAVIPFNYVARNAGTLNITQINLGVQLVIFTLLALASYLVFRRLQLRRRDSRQLQRVTQEEQGTNRTRDKFIVDAAQALQTDVAQLDQLTGALPTSKAATFILKGGTDLHSLLTKLAAAAQLRGGKSAEPMQPVKLNMLLASAMETLAAAALERGVTTQQDASAAVACSVRNPGLLTYVLRSVLDNAIAYSPDKGVIQISGCAAPAGTTITIADHGSGVPAEKIPLLFQPFFKAEGAEVFTHEGMGFSLYMDKLIMNYLGGSISLESEPGRGTIVTLRLPPAPQTIPATNE